MHQRALVVLGMHRSGTSALARALNLAGAALPENLVPAVSGENDAGFWEPAKLVEADKRTLAAAGAGWDSVDRIHPEWFRSDPAKAAVTDLVNVFEQEFPQQPLFVIKDPRLCRIVPLVREALERRRVVPKFILILRHPATVAASLAARNGLPSGHAQRLWLRYLLDAEYTTRNHPRIVIGFDELMMDWRATLGRIGKALDVTIASGPGIDDRIAEFLDPALVHHADLESDSPAALVGDAWAALRGMQAEGDTQALRDELDRVRNVLDQADDLLGTVVPSQPVDRQRILEDQDIPGSQTAGETGRENSPVVSAPQPIHTQSASARLLEMLDTLLKWGPWQPVASGFFEPTFYLARNSDVTGDPARHYMRRGRAEGRSPHPLFDPHYYARAAGIDHAPADRWFSHFLATGETLGINPHPLVDVRRLAKGYGMNRTPAGVFARFARDPDPPCNPHPLFDVHYYLGRYPDVAAQRFNPLVHYLMYGAAEGRQPSPYFDDRYYRMQLREPIPPGISALQHYVQSGGRHRVSPSRRFDPRKFAVQHPDATGDGADPLSACLDLYHGKVPEEFSPRDDAPSHAADRLFSPSHRSSFTPLLYWLRRQMFRDRFRLPGFWTALAPRIGFAVTRASIESPAGDYFTALELSVELQRQLPCKTVFLEMDADDSHDAKGLDVLVVMRDDYEVDQLRNRPPGLITIGWVRNWVERWADRPWTQDYDAYWASSAKAAGFLSKQLARPVETVPIATGDAFLHKATPREDLKSDYCFTGSYWNTNREISDWLNPDALPFKFALYGYGWERHPVFSRFTRGGLPYSRMKDVYASTRVVVDDANAVTKQWASVNSRVYDALAAGALVLTNGAEGANKVFGGLLPTYSSADELHALLTRYLTDEPARAALVEQLRRKVADGHTYRHRAQQVGELLRELCERQLRFAIKIATPNRGEREEWGDYHFAEGLRRALVGSGHAVRVDCLNDWDRNDAAGDDVVIVLRGLSPYEPHPDQINLMWNISHPDKVSDAEYERYDHVFVASGPYANVLKGRLRVPVTALLQCTDPDLFNPDVPAAERHEVLFVGNSRNVYRPVVKDALSAGVPLSVFGTRWEQFIPPRHVKGIHIPNARLAGYYRAAGAVLNDHWDSMRRHGFLSNRLFDAAACGARIVTDRIEGLEEIFGDLVLQYEEPGELKTAVGRLINEDPRDREKRLALARRVMQEHSFAARAQTILSVVLEHDRRKMSFL